MVKHRVKLVLFDMDGTLLQGRTIFVFAEKKGFASELLCIVNSNQASYEKTIEIATLLRGMYGGELLDIFRTIPLQDDAETVVRALKEKAIHTAIVTNSYQFVADDLKTRLGIDYAFANNLIIEKDIVTGDIVLNNHTLRRCDDGIIYSICKGDVLDHLCEQLAVSPAEVIAVGDGLIDLGMIKKAGVGIAFNAPEIVNKHAALSTSDLSVILDYV